MSENSSPEKLRIETTRPLQTRPKPSSKFWKLAAEYNPWAVLKIYRERPAQIPQKKPPFTLSISGLSLLLSFELLILITIATLWALSDKLTGFINIPDIPASIEGSTKVHDALLWGYSLLWTAFPAFSVSMCGKLFSKTTETLQEVQPTIELRKFTAAGSQHGKKSTAKLTILLDYGSEWLPFKDTFRAFQNEHFLIGICILVKWTFVGIGPLAAAIISVGNVPFVKVVSTTFFDDYINLSAISSQPAFESASAILLSSASPYAWTTKEYSVEPFFAESDATGNLTADTNTYSASLDCHSINIDALLGASNVTIEDDGSGNRTVFSFTDRGCSAQSFVFTTPSSPLWARTSYVVCPFEAGNGRLLFFTEEYDPSSVYLGRNLSMLSCIPSFRNSTSRITVLSGSGSLGNAGQVIDIVTDSSSIRPFWPIFSEEWMMAIPQYQEIDPTRLAESDNLGMIVYNYVKESNGDFDFAQAMNTTFSALFAAFATTSVYSPRAGNLTFPGMLSRPANRLFVVPGPALTVTMFVALAFLVTIWVAVFAVRHRHDLSEHLNLLLGHAILLENNRGVENFIQEARDDLNRRATQATKLIPTEDARQIALREILQNGDLAKNAEKVKDLSKWNCWIDNEGKLIMEHAKAPGGSSQQGVRKRK